MNKYKTEYKDYSLYDAILISTDRKTFDKESPVARRMVEHSKLYKNLQIIIFSKKGFQPLKLSENCIVYPTNSSSKFNYVFDAKKIGQNILKKLDDSEKVLITCQDPFETGLVGKWLKDFRKSKEKKYELLLQIHTDLFSPYFPKINFLNKIRLPISRRTLPEADVIRVVSTRIADSLVEEGIDENKIILKPIKVDTDIIKNSSPSFNLHQKYSQFEKIVIMSARLEPEKNIEMAIKAWKIVVEEKPNFGLLILGSGKLMDKLQKLSNSLNLGQKVLFLGWQNDLVSYYKGSDAFLCTSWYEGYGMALKEAEAAGCKIISTNVGIAKEIDAVIVDWNPKDIAKKIISI